MDFEGYLNSIKKNFGKTFKSENVNLELNTVDKELPPTGIVLDNPLLEYAFDRRFMAYGRCYLIYGKKGCSKTTMLFDLAKVFQKAGGKMFWVETESAPDFNYMRLQGVDDKHVIYHNPRSLEEALTLCKYIIENYSKYSDGKTPIMVALDSIAGAATDYERDQDIIGQQKVGEHAKLMAAFYRNVIPYLECENMVFVATNQLRDNISATGPGFGMEKPEALIGGEAQRFNSTYQFKVARIKDMLQEDHMGVKRKSGSVHTLTVKRNKLGREGNSQKIEFDIHINGGIDWYSPLVRMLGDNYSALVGKTGGWYNWKIPDTKFILNVDGEAQEGTIDTDKKFREAELAYLLANSSDAKEHVRKAFAIPDMPSEEIIEEINTTNKARRKKKSELEVASE